MKIIFDEGDKRCEEGYINNEYLKLIPKKGKYSLNFKITDVGKANMFLSQIFMDKEIVSILNDNAGIKITSVNLYPAVAASNIKDKLKSMINEIEYEESR